MDADSGQRLSRMPRWVMVLSALVALLLILAALIPLAIGTFGGLIFWSLALGEPVPAETVAASSSPDGRWEIEVVYRNPGAWSSGWYELNILDTDTQDAVVRTEPLEGMRSSESGDIVWLDDNSVLVGGVRFDLEPERSRV